MHSSRFAILSFLALAFPFSGCAMMDAITAAPSTSSAPAGSGSTTPRSAQDVTVASELSAAQAVEMHLIDSFSCKQDIGMESESLCISQLKDQAFRSGGELIVLQSKTPIPCRSASDKGACFTMEGEAYARKTGGDRGQYAYGHTKRSWMDVKIVSSLKTNEESAYRDLGTTSCRQEISMSTPQHSTTPAETCRLNLRTQAYDKGGDVVVIESNETIPCKYPTVDKGPCVAMTGHVWKDRHR